jgi:hypothetical protein
MKRLITLLLMACCSSTALFAQTDFLKANRNGATICISKNMNADDLQQVADACKKLYNIDFTIRQAEYRAYRYGVP